MLMNKASFQVIKNFIDDEDTIYKQETIEAIYPYIQPIMIIHTLGRVILMLISFKYLRICKTYFYYELLYMLLETLLPPSALSAYYNRRFIL